MNLRAIDPTVDASGQAGRIEKKQILVILAAFIFHTTIQPCAPPPVINRISLCALSMLHGKD